MAQKKKKIPIPVGIHKIYACVKIAWVPPQIQNTATGQTSGDRITGSKGIRTVNLNRKI